MFVVKFLHGLTLFLSFCIDFKSLCLRSLVGNLLTLSSFNLTFVAPSFPIKVDSITFLLTAPPGTRLVFLTTFSDTLDTFTPVWFPASSFWTNPVSSPNLPTISHETNQFVWSVYFSAIIAFPVSGSDLLTFKTKQCSIRGVLVIAPGAEPVLIAMMSVRKFSKFTGSSRVNMIKTLIFVMVLRCFLQFGGRSVRVLAVYLVSMIITPSLPCFPTIVTIIIDMFSIIFMSSFKSRFLILKILLIISFIRDTNDNIFIMNRVDRQQQTVTSLERDQNIFTS